METEDLKLHDYQLKLIEEIIKRPFIGLFVEMGLGKTVTTLAAINKLKQQGKIKKVLLIAPRPILENTWGTELLRWKVFDSLKYKHFNNYSKFKFNMENIDIFLIPPGSLKVLVMEKEYISETFDTLIIDESPVFKSHDSERFKQLKQILPVFKRRIILTGTPISNGYADLWTQIYILDLGKRLGRNITAYRNRYFQLKNSYYEYELREGCDTLIKEAIQDITVSLLKKDIGDESILKSNTKPIEFKSIIKYVPLSDYHMDFYKKFKRNFFHNFNGKNYSTFLDSSIEIKCKTAADLTNKLLQYSSGSIYTDDGKYIICHDRKIIALKEVIRLHLKDNILVIYNFKHEGERLQKEFPEAVHLTKDNILQWNKGKTKLAFFQVQTLSRGINLQDGGHILVWFGFTWSLELYQQTNARLYRQGQTKDVYCYHLCCTPIEEKLMRALSKKHATQQDLLNCLRSLYND